jgi:hypothetical protein
MTAHGYTSAAQAGEQFMPWAATHYGCRVLELGEDGADFAVSGHVPDRRALAAVLHYLRTENGATWADLRDEGWAERDVSVTRRWVHLDPDDEQWPWLCTDEPGGHPVTLVEDW